MRFALNKNGRYIHVSQASRTENYYCPFCGCAMWVCERNDVRFFDVMPGSAHSYQKCAVPRRRFPDLWLTTSRELENNLLSNVSNARRNKPADKQDRGDDDPLKSGYTEPNYSVVPLRFLSDFRREGIDRWPANTEINGHKLDDVFVSRMNAFVLMNDNEALGFRIVDVNFDKQVGENTLRFSLCDTTDGKKIKFFDLYIEDEEEYQILRYEVYTQRQSAYYIAGIWESIDEDVKNRGEWTVIGVQRTRFVSVNQIYRYKLKS